MYTGHYVLSQLLDLIHREQFHRCVQRYGGDYKVKHFSVGSSSSVWSSLNSPGAKVCATSKPVSMRERPALSSGTAGTGPSQHAGRCAGRTRLAHLRRSGPTADRPGRKLYAREPLALDLERTIYALDASIIDLCLSVYPWARFDAQRSGLKIHTATGTALAFARANAGQSGHLIRKWSGWTNCSTNRARSI